MFIKILCSPVSYVKIFVALYVLCVFIVVTFYAAVLPSSLLKNRLLEFFTWLNKGLDKIHA